MRIPDVEHFFSAAERIYHEIRDLSKHDATHALATALLKAYGKGGMAVFVDLRENPLIVAATPAKAR